MENHITLLRHSTTQQSQIKHVQSGEKLRPTATDTNKGNTLIQQTPTDLSVAVCLCSVQWPLLFYSCLCTLGFTINTKQICKCSAIETKSLIQFLWKKAATENAL